MLNHLEREDIFIPEISRSKHHGRHRQYTFRDLVVLRAINRLLELGSRPKRIKAAIATFSRCCPDIIGDTSLFGKQLKFAAQSGHFVVTKDEVLYCRGDEIVDLLKAGQLAFSFMIDNNECVMPSLHAATEVVALSPLIRRKGVRLEEIALRYSL